MPNLSVQPAGSLDPMTRLRNLSEVGAAVDVDENIPPRRYFRSGMEMVRMGNVYMEEENFENAFILYSKFITLFVEKLPQHHDYKQALPTDKASIKRKRLEEQMMIERAAKQREEEERHRRKKEQRGGQEEEHKLKIQTELEKWKIVAPADSNSSANVHLGPSLPGDELFDWSRWSNDANKRGQTEPSAPCLPDDSGADVMPVVPSRDLKPVNQGPANRIYNDLSGGTPSIDRSTKPSLLSPGSNSQAWASLRNITVPAILMPKFLSLAEKNTNLNIETCGILTGKLAQNRFTVTHLLVPKQMGTPDSCTTDNEEEIFEYQDQHDLITLGWIHTHPSQTSFMSSVDLHTHCAYQMMLPEAVAIVCSPKYNETGIYWLTNDYGLNYIAKCQQIGFHPHPKEPPLYIESEHVHVDSTATINIVDLR